MKENKIIIIGAGFASLSAACFLAKYGYDVTVLEKNEKVGGRARQLKRDGFMFDIGPSFYWMPDVFETFFNAFGKRVSDYYELEKLNPGYQVYFGKNNSISVPDNLDGIIEIFEEVEKGSGKKLKSFIDTAKENYEIAINDLVYKPGENVFEIVNMKTVGKAALFLKNIKAQVAKHVKDERLRKILEFPVLFLGAKSSDTPAFYNFMNYADFGLGTWHPKGGMYEVVEAMHKLAVELGVKIETNAAVESIKIENKKAKRVVAKNSTYDCDILLSGADYAHTEQLLEPTYRQYSEKYWDKKEFAPSALLFYVAFDTKIKNVSHHTLFFDTDFSTHEKAIYDKKEWMKEPLFYASFASMSDSAFAPEGKEAGTFLIPIAPGLEDTPEIRKKYFNILMERIEYLTGQELNEKVLFHESFCVNDFVSEYNSYKGNAYGLANTLLQTHILRPRLKSNKVKNLYFTGQLTVPGPGVPPSLISGNIVSNLIKKYHSKK